MPEGQSATFTVTLTEGTSTAAVVVDYSLVGIGHGRAKTMRPPSGKLTIGSSDSPAVRSRSRRSKTTYWISGETLKVRLDEATTTDGTATVSTDDTAETTITDLGTVQVSVHGELRVEEGDPPVDGRQVQRGGRRVGEFRGEAVGRGTGDRGGVLRDLQRHR